MKLFIAMPYGNKSGVLDIDGQKTEKEIPFDDVWREFIKPAIPDDWEAVRADESHSAGLITEKYMQDIFESDVFIADITFNNPNVFYELGIRQALSKRGTVLIQQKGNKRPFDVRTQKVIDYNLFMGTEARKFINDLKESLVTTATGTSGSPVHTFLPDLYIYNSTTGENPDKTIKSLTKKIDDLSVKASTKSGSAEQFERQRSLRSELTDLLSRIVRAHVQNAKLFKEHADDPQYINNISSSLNQENAFLLNEAVSIIDQIPDLVGSVEYNTIAYSLSSTGDLSMAETYYVKAIDASKSDVEKSMSQKSYAVFLAQKGMITESRAMYEKALDQVPAEDNYSHSVRGTTLQTWGMSELTVPGNEHEAKRLFDLAQQEFEAIDNPITQMQLMTTLNAVRGSMSSQGNDLPADVLSKFQDFFNKQ